MGDFFTNKYVMKGAIQGDKPADPYCDLPVGTVFTIDSIHGDWVILKPIHTPITKCVNTQVSPAMLAFGFTQSSEVYE